MIEMIENIKAKEKKNKLKKNFFFEDLSFLFFTLKKLFTFSVKNHFRAEWFGIFYFFLSLLFTKNNLNHYVNSFIKIKNLIPLKFS